MGEIASGLLAAKSSMLSLEDRYTISSGRLFLNGYQALVRLLMMQRSRDRAAGLDTAGFVSGYRGSPLGGLDQTLWNAHKHLTEHQIVFQPGINEDLAATAVWGTQQVNLFPGAKHDGVFGMWYGKGPGVDRSGDVLRHANAAGTSRHGGVLMIVGDDHVGKSSSLPHQTDYIFQAVSIPVLAPAGIQEYLDFGIHGWALSRYSGCWVAFKAVSDTVETTASVDVDPFRVNIVVPDDFEMPPDGLSIRWPDPPLVQEKRLLHHKLYAALAYCRTNRLNRVVIDSPNPRLGIVTCGKSYLDVRQAFDDLGIDERLSAEIGIRLYKVGMVWPLEAEGVRYFAEGLEEILVIEEKRQLVEYQLKEELYNWREDVRPRVIGKFDETGAWLLPIAGELTPAIIARAIASRVQRFFQSPAIQDRLAFLLDKEHAMSRRSFAIERLSTYCPGCPHNTSTKVPDGSRVLGGIGCHYMAMWMPDRNTATFAHMGGEGVPWVGQAPFTTTPHVFANLGDGTYFHSGSQAIRQAVAAGVNITYKILFNGAVAMTGGQPVEGDLSVSSIAARLAAEGVDAIVVVNDGTPREYTLDDLPDGVRVRHRDELDAIQRELRETPGVTALIYDQACAAELRRRRKRGSLPEPVRRVFINELVCEGCGDCGTQSSCMAIVPVDTKFGRKRAVDQSTCNQDYSCLKGFCPSFVTIEGGQLRKGLNLAPDGLPELPLPALPSTTRPYGILIAGVGGSGVVTIGALIGMAAHLDGRGVTVLDISGLAQKGGTVHSHVRIADSLDDLHAARIAAGEADAVIGGDLVVGAATDSVDRMRVGRTRAVVNCAEIPTMEFTRDPDWRLPLAEMQASISEAVGESGVAFIDASGLAMRLLGDTLAANVLLLGYAWQKGLVPVTLDSLHRAIELNGIAVDMNRQALRWGRRAAHDDTAVRSIAYPAEAVHIGPQGIEEIVERRVAYLTDYQDAAYAQRYRRLVDRVRVAEQRLGSTRLTEAVACNYFKLLAYKDEYEVARLHSDPAFLARIASRFKGDYRLRFHLAPPFMPRPTVGHDAKYEFGQPVLILFRLLARLRGLRGTIWDPFAHSADRRLERALIDEYEEDVARICDALDHASLDLLIELASLPESIRGYGHVKRRAAEQTQVRRQKLWGRIAEPLQPDRGRELATIKLRPFGNRTREQAS